MVCRSRRLYGQQTPSACDNWGLPSRFSATLAHKYPIIHMELSQVLREKIAHMPWFHAVDLGEFSTSGRFKQGRPQNTTLYGTFEFLKAMNLEGSSCLDIGTVDGLIAFGLSKLGSSNIHATDTHSRDTFLLLLRFLIFPLLALSTGQMSKLRIYH